MLLDLREIIDVPGGKVLFEFTPDMSEAASGSIIRIEEPTKAKGNVTNSAGVLTFSANIEAICTCICARCLKEFKLPIHKKITANLTEEGEGENPDGYFLQGDMIDADEIVITEFILDLDDTILCSEDCAGLCQNCGTDLNESPCKCEKEIDPRLAKLRELLDD